MYSVMNRVSVAAAWRSAFEERFQKRADQVERQSGFVRMSVLRPEEPGADGAYLYVVETLWRDRTAFEAWVGSEDFRQAHANPLPQEAYAAPGRMEAYEVIISAEGEPSV